LDTNRVDEKMLEEILSDDNDMDLMCEEDISSIDLT
jgi:hypothetical protein